MIAIVDLGLGNLFSVKRAVEHVGGRVVITDDHALIQEAERIILPGVGSFKAGMDSIDAKSLRDCLMFCVSSGTPLLGICLGMQLLMEGSEEGGGCEGLGIIPGQAISFRNCPDFNIKYKVPYIGWGVLIRTANGQRWEESFLNGIKDGDSCYFVHSYRVIPDAQHYILSLTRYGGCEYASSIADNNVAGCQFHPEKSGVVGLKIIKNFIKGGLYAE